MKNPLRGLRFSLLDFAAARSTTGTKIAMAGIALIPLIYGALYLMAFYDPYGNLDAIPVAVVNEDVPVYTEGGQQVSAGADLVAELKESKSLDYHFLSSDAEAEAGLEDGTYYNKIVIPEDFSQKIASADSDDPQKANLVLVTNDANNYLSSILGASVMRVVTAKTNAAVGENYYVQIFDKVGDTGTQLSEAADGAGQLAGGLADAEDGSATITSGLSDARDGSEELGEGLASAHDGSATITQKLGDAKDGAKRLDDGLVSAKDGSHAISSNLKTAADGAATLDAGLKQLESGLATGKTGAQELAAGLHKLQTQGSAQLAAGASGLVDALDAQAGNVSTLDGGVTQLVDTLASAGPAVQGLSAMVSDPNASDVYFGGSRPSLTAQLAAIETNSAAAFDGAATLVAKGQDAATLAGELQTSVAALPGALTGVGTNIQTAASSLYVGEGTTPTGGAVYDAAAAAQAAGAAKTGIDTALVSLNAVSTDGMTDEQKAAIEAVKSQLGAASTSADAASQSAQGARDKAAAAAGQLKDAATTLTGVGNTLGGLYTADKTGTADKLLADLAAIQAGMPALKGGVESMVGSAKTMMGDAQTVMGQSQALLSPLSAKSGELGALKAGMSTLATSLTSDVYDADKNPVSLHAAATALSAGAGQVDESMLTAAAGADKLADGTVKLADGAESAQGGAAALKAGLAQLSQGSLTLTSGLSTARTGSAALASGMGQLEAGSATLTSGLVSAEDGSATLTSGLVKLHDGSQTLTGGLVDATDGAAELAAGLDDGVSKVEESVAGADGRAQMMSEPVELTQEAYTEVENYGTGFAPYFIALGLWVGALVMTFLLKPLNKRLIASGAEPAVAAFAGLVPWMIVGVIQSVLLGATIQFACGISVLHSAAYYALIILSSIVYCAMIQAITAVFGFPGKFVAVVLLMLQLTTAAGTFPIQTEFSIFQTLSPWLPMTYIVHALRIAMRGVDLSLVAHDIAMLAAFGGASFVLTCLAARRKRLITMMDLHPLVDL